jgi:hypothetical protein
MQGTRQDFVEKREWESGGAWLRARLGAAFSPAPNFGLARWLFLRLLGVAYLAAFLSLAVQIQGLIGQRGILPASEYLTAVRQVTGGDRYYLLPTICWLDASDAMLNGLCIGGAVLAGLLIVGVAPAPVLFFLWAAYLSLMGVGQVFLGYQWDSLLLETGFLAIFIAPLQAWPRPARAVAPTGISLWLLRWLLFRLLFGSGMVKLLSGDPTWRKLTALRYHYWTQPLPTWTSWYLFQMPGWFQSQSVLFTFLTEILLPLGIFGPRRLRHIACAGAVALQLLIAATGNYGFFNLLTITLCVLLLDDEFFPLRWRTWLSPSGAPPAGGARWSGWLLGPVMSILFALSLVPFLASVGLTGWWPGWLLTGYRAVSGFHVVNNYGLFAVMTTERREIIVEGSDDGQTWLPYEFKWKPGDVRRRPGFTGLHMPRLDWQMWFAALGSFRQSPWFGRFLMRLGEGSPEVLALLERNPFPDRPPHYLRAAFFDYHFTDLAARHASGAWWQRDLLGLYCPMLAPAGENERGVLNRSRSHVGASPFMVPALHTLHQFRQSTSHAALVLEGPTIPVQPLEPVRHAENGPRFIQHSDQRLLFHGEGPHARIGPQTSDAQGFLIGHETSQQASEINRDVIDLDTAKVDHAGERLFGKEQMIVPDITETRLERERALDPRRQGSRHMSGPVAK